MTRRDLVTACGVAALGAGVAACGGRGTVSNRDPPRTTASPAEADKPVTGAAPVAAEWIFPGEWEPHAACVMAWPWSDRIWGGWLADIQNEVAGIARSIAAFEPVVMVANPGSVREARRRCGREVEVVEVPIDDFWTRDTAAIFVVNASRRSMLGLDFTFNGWGGKFPPWDKDDALPAAVCRHLGVPRRRIDLVLEGGSVISDGEGTLITTEECLLHPSRNPDLSREEIEARLKRELGASTVIWLPYGLDGDWITNGHVDGVAAFLAPGKVLVQTTPGSGTPDEARLKLNRDVLHRSMDARGRRLEIVDMPEFPNLRWRGETTALTYINFYLANGSVIVPVGDVRADKRALAILRDQFPDRTVVGTPARAIAFGGGGVHCVTQQVPALA